MSRYPKGFFVDQVFEQNFFSALLNDKKKHFKYLVPGLGVRKKPFGCQVVHHSDTFSRLVQKSDKIIKNYFIQNIFFNSYLLFMKKFYQKNNIKIVVKVTRRQNIYCYN